MAKIPGQLPDIHACPPEESGVTPCCNKTPFELDPRSQMTLDDSLVSCGRFIRVAVRAEPTDGATDLAERIIEILDDPYKAPELRLVLIRESCNYVLGVL